MHPGIVGGEFPVAVDNSAKGHAALRYELLHFVKECIVDAGASRLTSTLGATPAAGVAGMIDHTLLKPDATQDQIAPHIGPNA
mgnify:CR=1 FL=1